MPIHRTESGVPPSKAKVVKIGGFTGSSLAAGGSESNTYTPGIGLMWEVMLMWLHAPAPIGSAAGTHKFKVYSDFNYVGGESVFNSNLSWDYSSWISADSYQHPSTEVAALTALTSIVINKDYPLHVMYSNDTDVAMTGNRQRYFLVKETPII